MVEGQLHCRKHFSAILTLVAVTNQDVLTREQADPVWHPAIRLEPDHRREHDSSMDFPASMLLNMRSILDDENESTTRRADMKRLIAGIENQYRIVHDVTHRVFLSIKLEQEPGIEPGTSVYETDALPTTPSLLGAENGTRTRVIRVAL